MIYVKYKMVALVGTTCTLIFPCHPQKGGHQLNKARAVREGGACIRGAGAAGLTVTAGSLSCICTEVPALGDKAQTLRAHETREAHRTPELPLGSCTE